MPNPYRLDILRLLREKAGMSQEVAATYCGLAGRQGRLSLGAWERGESIPQPKRRARFLPYLWDHLKLRSDPQQFQQVWAMLSEEWEWEPISDGEWQRLTSAPRPTLSDTTAQAAQPSPPVPFQAPALTPHFVGRHTEFNQLEALLTDPTAPHIVALVGMGGIGKTTLATHSAHSLRTYFRDGILWANVALSHPLDILQSWAQAYGRDFSTLVDIETRAAVFRDLFSPKQALMVLDDVRQPEIVRPLLPNGAKSIVLLTTRDHDVAAALNAFTIEVEQIKAEDSEQLLISVLGQSRVAAEATIAAAIGELLQHYPLALEIVAKLLARAQWQTLWETLDRLREANQRLNRLHFKDLSVRVSFDVSWFVLNQELRTVFSCLSLWEGRSFAAAAVSYLLQQPEAETVEQLLILVSLSLLKVDGEGRFGQHPLLADYARERLERWEPMLYRQAQYYLELFEMGSEEEQLALEYPNAMIAMQRLAAGQEADWLVRFALALTPLWLRQARYHDARRGLAWGVAAAQQLEQMPRAAQLLIDWGYICAEQGDGEEAKQHEQTALRFAQLMENDSLMATAQFHLARLAIEQGDYEQADQLLTDCLTLREKFQDRIGIARALHSRAMILSRNGSYQASNQLAQDVLSQQELLQDVPGLLATLRLLVENKLAERQNQEAAEYNERFMALALQHNYQAEVAEACFCAANVARRLKQWDQARLFAQDAYERFTRMGNRPFLAATLYEQSAIEFYSNSTQEAKRLGNAALDLMQTLKDDFNRVYCHLHLGDVELKLGNVELASMHWQQGLELGIVSHHPAVKFLRSRLGLAS